MYPAPPSYTCVVFLRQGDPGPRGEQGREGSTGPNGDPVRHLHSYWEAFKSYSDVEEAEQLPFQLSFPLAALFSLFPDEGRINPCSNLQHPYFTSRRQDFGSVNGGRPGPHPSLLPTPLSSVSPLIPPCLYSSWELWLSLFPLWLSCSLCLLQPKPQYGFLSEAPGCVIVIIIIIRRKRYRVSCGNCLEWLLCAAAFPHHNWAVQKTWNTWHPGSTSRDLGKTVSLHAEVTRQCYCA